MHVYCIAVSDRSETPYEMYVVWVDCNQSNSLLCSDCEQFPCGNQHTKLMNSIESSSSVLAVAGIRSAPIRARAVQWSPIKIRLFPCIFSC